jgi:NitT/TauT family transport system substrate-binding protein
MTRSALFTLAALALAVVVVSGDRAAQAQPAPIVLRLGGNPADDVTSVLYAQRTGLFAKAGLDVQLQRITSTAGLPAAVAGGTYDIAKTSLTSLFAAREHGLLFKIIAPAALYDDATNSHIGGFIIPKDAPFPAGRDFNGKTVAVITLNGIGNVALNAWVEQHGGDWKSVHYVELPMSAAPEAVAQHRVFAAESANPLLAEALATGNVQLVPAYGAIAPSFLFSVWFTTADWAAQHRDAARAFARVVAQAAAYTNAHPVETASLLAEATAIPLATIERMPRVTNGTSVNLAQIQPVIDAAARYKAIDAVFPAADVVDSGR